MANVNDCEQFFEVSKARLGHKREFTFSLGSHIKVGCSSISRTRSNKNRNVLEPKRSRTTDSVKNDVENIDEEEVNVELKDRVLDEIPQDLRGNGVIFDKRSRRISQKNTKKALTSNVILSNTKKFPSKLKELLDSRILEGLQVKYNRGIRVQKPQDKVFWGVIKGNGIVCHCDVCNGENKVMSPNEFEFHAGSKNKRPSDYIFLENENSLRGIMNVFLNNTLENLEEVVDEALGNFTMKKSKFCVNCKDANVVSRLLCHSCEASKTCQLTPKPIVPQDSSSSSYKDMEYTKCSDKNERKLTINNIPQNDISPVVEMIAEDDALDQITQMCILCSERDFSEEFGPQQAIKCNQCEKQYHIRCLKDHNIDKIEEVPKEEWFCCLECEDIQMNLQKLVARENECLSNSLLSLIRKKKEEKSLKPKLDLNIKWRVLHPKLNNSKEITKKVLTIFNKEFKPIIETRSGKNIVQEMLSGSTISQEYSFEGIYCSVIIDKGVVASAGVFRVFGTEVAELPLVATNARYKGQGYFQSLLSCIENMLGRLKVKRLVVLAAHEVTSMWTSKFGFTELEEDEIKYYKNLYPIMMFEGSSFLHKPIPSPQN